ncbi:MAG: histidinol dehydrogenase [Bacteroidales bacterium]|nr:histidinol dehydrogenase [Bacteroidales bacterium]
METILNPEYELWQGLCCRASFDDTLIAQRVAGILERVQKGGDGALREITREIDGTAPADFKVSGEEIEAACRKVSQELKSAIAQAAANIRKFHEAQRTLDVEVETMPGIVCRRRQMPISRVGLYIPGGSAPLFSTLLMLAIPAGIAGCREIVLCTPCSPQGEVSPAILYAASVCGVSDIYKLGGAQAIAAMAYGTESVPKVHKIFGPGNRYVTKAKQMVSATGTAIDMPAGPSEVMVLADNTANPVFVAADFLSQAEHGPDSQAILVCDNRQFAERTFAEINRQLALLPRENIASKALEHSRIIVFEEGRQKQIEFANSYAAEHLIVSLADPWEAASQITAAGSVFIGNYSPESAGDYASGTNHTLPTMGLATAFSGIGLDSFMHSITYQELTPRGLESIGTTIVTMAEAEGLEAHAAAVKCRLAQ